MFLVFLWLHIAAGTAGLVLGPISMFSKKKAGLHTIVGTLYFYLMALVCISALALAVLHWEKSWWFALVAGFSFSFALKGFKAARGRGKNWLKKHISGMLGSYIAMTTALLVVNASKIPGYSSIPAIIFWLLPTIIGSPLIAMTVRKYTGAKKTAPASL